MLIGYTETAYGTVCCNILLFNKV